MLTNSDLAELIALRRSLHRDPEISGQEHRTAARIAAVLAATGPDRVLTGLGGTGLAAIYDSGCPGPTVMVRAELDALPIHELGDVPYRSEIAGKGHLCGHDGHMTILCGLARLLGRARPERGRVVLLFQPAEETGCGAAAVMKAPGFGEIAPDIALALHNLPGLPLGAVGLIDGPANCASRGLAIELTGKTAHASMPETGTSPAAALCRLIPGLTALGPGGRLEPGFRLVTVTHAAMGEPCFGVAPGAATLMATLRCLQDREMAVLCREAEVLVARAAEAEGLEVSMDYHDVFHACANDTGVNDVLSEVCAQRNVRILTGVGPMRWSEDFGLFGHSARAAMFLLGAGTEHPQLHNPDYDFPEELIAVGVDIFSGAIRRLTG